MTALRNEYVHADKERAAAVKEYRFRLHYTGAPLWIATFLEADTDQEACKIAEELLPDSVAAEMEVSREGVVIYSVGRFSPGCPNNGKSIEPES